MEFGIEEYGRITSATFKGGIATMFALAMLAVIGRVIIRWVYHKRYFTDDYVLFFGCMALISALVLNFVMFEYINLNMFIGLGPTDKLSFSAEVMNWLVIFSVKFSYLLFFRQMVDRLKGILVYWKVTMGIVVVSCAFCICGVFITCPHFGPSASECAQKSGIQRVIIWSWVTNSLDMLTDLLIVVVPIALLRRVKIRFHQKVVLGSLLCLSLCMFAITIVRAAKELVEGKNGKALDVQWFLFWHFVEASVAVMVVSLTAFRSLYSLKAVRADNEKRRQPWLYSYRKVLSSRRRHKVDGFGDTIPSAPRSLPHIPGATMTGIRSMIDRRSWINLKRHSTHSAIEGVIDRHEHLEVQV